MKTAVIIGAGPAGLTAAYELLTKTDIKPILVEADRQVGGLAKTIDFKGNKIDIGGHRFFSKSTRVLNWWLNFLPLEPGFAKDTVHLGYQNNFRDYVPPAHPDTGDDDVMLVRKRKSRIYHDKKFFDYPLRLNRRTIRNLGLRKLARIGLSYLYAKLFPKKPEKNLEQFFRNRFGNELYLTFFKDYTEKVWGVPCHRIPASWGQQRVKDLNIARVLGHAIKSIFTPNQTIRQKGTSTSLIEQFLYPKYGPGQMWETVAKFIIDNGGVILTETTLESINGDGNDRVSSVDVKDNKTGAVSNIPGDYFFSSMPVKELVGCCNNLPVPTDVKELAGTLEYRDFLIVGILASRLALKEQSGPITDNWIYIQDKAVRVGRLQFFHNWSPAMVRDPANAWIGAEYFCDESDALWQMDDDSLGEFVIREMEAIGILRRSEVRDLYVARVKNAYPSYYGGYANFKIVEKWLNRIENLFPVGRNGMHRYNNSDHSMLTAMTAVENIIAGVTDKSNIWNINTEEEYHEEYEPSPADRRRL